MEQRLVQNPDQLAKAIEDALNQNRRVFLFCSGSTDGHTGDSWCVDCCNAEPILEACLKSSNKNDLFLMIEIGSESEWKNENNYYRKHPVYKLENIPALLHIGSKNGQQEIIASLIGKQCLKSDEVRKFFE